VIYSRCQQPEVKTSVSFITSVNDISDKLVTGVVDIGDKFMTNVADNRDKFMTSVVDTCEQSLDTNNSMNVHKNSKWLKPNNQGPGGR